MPDLWSASLCGNKVVCHLLRTMDGGVGQFDACPFPLEGVMERGRSLASTRGEREEGGGEERNFVLYEHVSHPHLQEDQKAICPLPKDKPTRRSNVVDRGQIHVRIRPSGRDGDVRGEKTARAHIGIR
eukprot:751627-Hanusia_phi.AAC.2